MGNLLSDAIEPNCVTDDNGHVTAYCCQGMADMD